MKASYLSVIEEKIDENLAIICFVCFRGFIEIRVPYTYLRDEAANNKNKKFTVTIESSSLTMRGRFEKSFYLQLNKITFS